MPRMDIMRDNEIILETIVDQEFNPVNALRITEEIHGFVVLIMRHFNSKEVVFQNASCISQLQQAIVLKYCPVQVRHDCSGNNSPGFFDKIHDFHWGIVMFSGVNK